MENTKLQEFKEFLESLNYEETSTEKLEELLSEIYDRISECAYHISLRAHKFHERPVSSEALAKGRPLKNNVLFDVPNHDLADYHALLIQEATKIHWILRTRKRTNKNFKKK